MEHVLHIATSSKSEFDMCTKARLAHDLVSMGVSRSIESKFRYPPVSPAYDFSHFVSCPLIPPVFMLSTYTLNSRVQVYRMDLGASLKFGGYFQYRQKGRKP